MLNGYLHQAFVHPEATSDSPLQTVTMPELDGVVTVPDGKLHGFLLLKQFYTAIFVFMQSFHISSCLCVTLLPAVVKLLTGNQG